MFKLDLKRQGNQRLNYQHLLDHWKSKGVQEKYLLLLYWQAKAFDAVDHNKLQKILKNIGITGHLTCLLRNLHAGQEATELDMEQQTSFKSGKEYIKAVYCHHAYLTFMQSTSWEMPGWMKHKLKSRLPGIISIISNIQMTQPYGRK